MESKLELRMEAVRIAAQLGSTSAQELVKNAQSIEGYILGNANLPEQVCMTDSTPKVSEEEDIFLQVDGNKVE